MFARLHRLAAYAGALVLAAAAFAVPARAGVGTDSTYYITRFTSNVLPSRPCVGRPESLVVGVGCPKCQVPLGLFAVDANHSLVRVLQQPAAICDTETCLGVSLKRPLGLLPAGPATQYIEFHAIIPADATHPQPDSVVWHQAVTYDVAPACPGPPVDSTAFLPFLSFGLSSPRPCTAMPETLVVNDSCNACLALAWDRRLDANHVSVGFFRRPDWYCGSMGCQPIAQRWPLGLLPAGPGVQYIEVHVTYPGDSLWVTNDSLVFRETVRYNVADSCGPILNPVPGLPYVEQVSVLPSTSTCDTCPPIICGDRPFRIGIRGEFTGNCWQYEGMHVASDPNVDPSLPLTIDLSVRLVSSICATVMVPFSDSLWLTGASPGRHPFVVREFQHNTADSTVRVFRQAYAFVAQDCDSMRVTLPHVQHVAFGVGACDTCAGPVCPDTPMRVTVSGLLPNVCWEFTGLSLLPVMSPIDGPIVVANFRDPCPSFAACPPGPPVPFRGTIAVDAGPVGMHPFELRPLVHACSDSSSVTPLPVITTYYTVTDSCRPALGCVMPFLRGRSPDSSGCSLYLAPEGPAAPLRLSAMTDVPLAGLQGSVDVHGPVTLDTLVASGAAKTMHLVTRRTATGMSYVLYADQGAPIPAGAATEVLVAIVRGHYQRDPDPAIVSSVSGTVTAGADSLGRTVPPCPVAIGVWPAVHVCIDSPRTCDVNRDGVIDVADLVRMARCWWRPAACTDSLAHPDCTGDGAFHIDDILCCARTVLGGGRDSSVQAAPNLRLSLGEAQLVGGKLRVALALHGAGDMGGALLHVTFPADRYSAAALTDAVPSGWLPLAESGSTDLVLGLMRMDDAAPADFTLPLEFTLRDGQSPGGSVAIDAGSISAPDGSELRVDLSQARSSLPGGGGSITHIELLCGPNPASEATRFVVRLPAAAQVDLGLYDVAGRRVATLWRGGMTAGETTVPWNATTARAGVYFARLLVNGTARTTRLTVSLPH